MTDPMRTALPPAALAAVPTPALVVDMAAARANHRRAGAMMGPGQRLRPHFKAHKTIALAELQRSGPVAGLCCQTSWEAVTLAEAGFPDVLVTNQIVDRTALAEIARAAAATRLSVIVDDPAQVGALDALGVGIEALIEIDVGMHRCGVPPDGEALLAIAAAVAASRHLTLAGLQAYEGHVVGLVDPAARRRGLEAAAELVGLALDRLRRAGFPVATVGGGGTGTLPFLAELGVWTEIQAGSYLLMDSAYAECPDLRFQPALWVLATVLHASPGRIVVDAGLKQISTDKGGPLWPGDPAATLRLSDEHTKILTALPDLPRPGDRLLLVPRHVDPTINLHPALWLHDAGSVRPVPVDGRMPLRG